MRARALIVAVLALFSACENCAATEPRPPSILVLQQSDSRGPFPNAIFSTLITTVSRQAPRPVSVYVENLDLSRFGGTTYEESLLAHLYAKFDEKPLGVIVAIGAASLDYAIRVRQQLWPGVPIVFAMVDEPNFRGMVVPPNVTGSLMRLNFSDMIKVARATTPDLKGVVIIGDSFQHQTAYRHFADEIPSATKDIALIDLMGLPMTALRERVAHLPNDSVILYLAVYSDGRGTYYPPVHALSLLGEVANRPIVVAVESLINGASVGGFVIKPALVGERAAEIALRVLEGEDASQIKPMVDEVVKPVFDWRQLERWKVDESRLPAGSEIRHRPVSVWDQYSWHILGAGAVFLALLVLLVTLLRERHVRFAAEVTASQRMSELAHINRHATAGEMSAAIAHELNQPLGAILNNAEAAAIMLETDSPDVGELKAILSDIRRDDERAGEIIKRLRTLVSKKIVDFQHVDLNDVSREALAVAEIQAHSGGITLHSILSQSSLPVSGDAIQLQQVILNLAMNAIEATKEKVDAPRDIIARTSMADNNSLEFSISDFGPGIATDKLKHLFDPFFTTKSNGMGMGLSLARTIIEAHGGRLWAENGATGGAIFRFRLPMGA